MNFEESEGDESYKPGMTESEAEFTSDEGSISGGASESEAEFTDSEEEGKTSKRSKKQPVKAPKKAKKEKRSRFLDVEAVVGDGDDDEDEDDLLDDDFIAGDDEAEEAAAAAAEIGASRLLRRSQEAAEKEFDAEAEERRLKALYGRVRESQAMKAAAQESATIPKPFLLPTVTDPKLWLCKAQQGRERSSALALLRVIMERQYSGQPLSIFSVVARDGLNGYVYIEAHKPSQVAQAIELAKLNHCLYPGQAGKSLVLVPMAEMPQVLQTTAATGGSAAASAEIPEIGDWVRIKRGKHANDLAQVVDNVQDEGSYDPSNVNSCIIRVKLVPRLQFSASTESSGERPPPRAFDPEEASRHGVVSKSRGFWIYGGESYKDGMLFKNVRMSSLITGRVGPTAEEIARFPDAEGGEGRQGKNEFDAISSSGNRSESSALVPGDHVVITEGEMKNLHAVVDSLEVRPNPATGQPENIAHVIADEASGLTGDAAKLQVKIAQLRKTFLIGEHVRVLSGPRAGESGIVVSEQAGGTRRQPQTLLILFSAINNEQFTVNAASCVRAEAKTAPTEAPETVRQSPQKLKQQQQQQQQPMVSLDDLVQYEGIAGEEGVGVVVRILDAENSLVLFDSLGQIKTVPGKNIQLLASAPLPNRSAFADDSRTIKQGDRISDSTGSFFKALHVYKSLAFLRPLSGGINGGVCVMPLDNLSKPMMNSSASAPAFGAFAGRGLLGKSVSITGGPYKGYVGFVKQINDGVARVELHTNGKVVSVPADRLSLSEKDFGRRPTSSAIPAYASSSSARTPAWNAAASSARTPAWNSGSARTPAWNSSGSSARTPAWNSGSARTPAWNSASATTPGIAPGRTPAWSAATGMTPAWNSSRTPAWNASSSSARTPAWDQGRRREDSLEQPEKKSDEWDQVKDWKQDEY